MSEKLIDVSVRVPKELETKISILAAQCGLDKNQMASAMLVLSMRSQINEDAVGEDTGLRDITTYESTSADVEGHRRFTEAMLAKLEEKSLEGRYGWNTDCSVLDLTIMLQDQVNKGNMVNAANFCMMLWNLKNPKGR